MRVLQVHKDFEPLQGGGGTARHIHGLSKALVEHGCEVRVIAPLPEQIVTPYVSIPASRLQFWQHMRWADVVHVHGARSSYAVAGALASKAAGKPFFYTPHAYYDNGTAFNAFTKKNWDATAERFLLAEASCTFLLTDVWRDVLKQRGLPIDKTAIIPNCVTGAELAVTAMRGSAQKLTGSPAILSVGRLDPVKRLRDVVAALQLPELALAHLHIVGKGSERAAIEQCAADLGIGNRITLHGFVQDDDVAKMVAGSDVFILASEQEGLPTVLLEMLIGRLPIACSRIPGNMAIANVAGVTTHFDVGDHAGLARAVTYASQSIVSDESISALRREFTWEERAEDILDFYKSAAHPRQKAA